MPEGEKMVNILLEYDREPQRLPCPVAGCRIEHSQCLKRWKSPDYDCGECSTGLFVKRRLQDIPAEEMTDTPFGRKGVAQWGKRRKENGVLDQVLTCTICAKKFKPRSRHHKQTCGDTCYRESVSRTRRGVISLRKEWKR